MRKNMVGLNLVTIMFIASSLEGSFGHFNEGKMTDVKTLWRSDGTVQMNYTSNSQLHTLKLVESKLNLSAVPVRFAAASGDDGAKQTLQGIRLLRNSKNGDIMLFREVEGSLELLDKVGNSQHRQLKQNSRTFKTLQSPTRNFHNKHKQKEMTKTLGRRKRSKPVPLSLQKISGTVELAWIIDYSVFNSFQPLPIPSLNESSVAVNLIAYYAHLTSMMNDFFNTLQNDYVEVSITFAGIYIINSPTEVPDLIENHISSGKLDGVAALERLSKWVTSTAGMEALPSHDHVMLSMLYDINGGTGQAYKGGICTPALSVSLIEATGSLTWNALAAAKNLATSLGADEDGTGSATHCANDRYLMGDSFGILGYKFLFSCCSQRAFYGTMHSKGDCLLTTHASHNYSSDIDQNVSEYKPGEIFTADIQCQLAHGTESCGDYSNSAINFCTKLDCIDPRNSSKCVSTETPAADGTWCGTSKWCLQGACIANTVSMLDSYQSCDVWDCYGDEGKCSNGVNRFYPEMNRCYDKQLDCDGVRDCSDEIDEYSCDYVPPFNCSDNEWVCRDGINTGKQTSGTNRYCVQQLHICDGEEDCSDGSDEEDCGDQNFCFLCSNNLCITSPFWCGSLCPYEMFDCQQNFYRIRSGCHPTRCGYLTFLLAMVIFFTNL